jgi:D-alanyl-D-alanine carboxypeptidase (penicillin-binding protein 5/6)
MLVAFLATLAPPADRAEAAIQAPDVSATGVYAYDMDTGIELFAKNEHERLAIGSVAKVVTSLVVVAYADLDAEVAITEADVVDDPSYSNMQLQAGDTLTVSQLLYGLLVPSGTDAADALARYVGGIITGSDDQIAQLDGFVAEMNAFVAQQGLENTRFTNPHGLDSPNNYSSAYDIAQLSGMLMDNDFLASVVAEPGYSFLSKGAESRQYHAETTNKLLGQSGVAGVKTGSTEEAGGCVVLARRVNDGTSTVIAAVLGATLTYDGVMIDVDERWNDATRLFQFMDANFAWLPLADAETFANLPTELSVWDVQVSGSPMIPVTTGDSIQTTYQLALDPDGGGSIEIFYDQDRVGSLPLEPASAHKTGLLTLAFPVLAA